MILTWMTRRFRPLGRARFSPFGVHMVIDDLPVQHGDDPAGLCGWFYHDIFPSLQTFQFGGRLPWWEGDTIKLQCLDSYNLVTIQLERSKRD